MSTADETQPESWFERAIAIGPVRWSLFLWLAVFACGPLFHDVRNGGSTFDWQFFQFFDEIARKTLLDYHQLPIWNPYFCGGTTLVGNPQTTFLVPTFPLVLLFGTTYGERLTNLVVIIVSCEGGYRLLRHLGVRHAAALLGAFAFPLYGRTWGWLTDGQYGLQGTTLETWILYGFLRGLERPVYLALGAAFYAWLISFRGIQPGPQMAMALGLWAVFEGRRRWLDTRSLRRALWPLAACFAMGLLAGAFAGLRMVPVLQTVLGHPRIVVETTHRLLTEIFVEIYAMPMGTPGYGASGYTYIGIFTFILYCASFSFAAPRRRAAIPLLVSLWFLLLTLGYQGNYSPYPFIKSLPLYRSLRNPTLYAFTGALFLVIPACFALDELDKWLRARRTDWVRKAALVVVPLLVVGTGIEMAARGRALLASPGLFGYPPIPRIAEDFHQARGNEFFMPMWPYVDRGTIDCYDETPWPASMRLRPDLPAEEYLLDAGAGSVQRVSWSPNRIVLDVNLTRPARVVVNQNLASGWHASVGNLVSEGGLVAVDLPAGHHELVLSVWPVAVTLGFLLMLAGIGVAVWLLRRDRRQRRAEQAAA